MIKKLFPFIIVILAVILGVSCYMVISNVTQSNNEIEEFEDLLGIIYTSTPLQESSNTEVSAEDISTDTSEKGGESLPDEQAPIFKRNLAPLFEQNADCIGWVYIENTKIDYPVMFTPEEPQKYLNRNFKQKYSSSGVPFLQENAPLQSDNLILYGHNMKNGTMFAAVKEYRKESFLAEHPIIEFETVNGLKCYRVFAVVQLKNTDPWYSFISAADESEFDQAVSDILARALHKTDVIPEYGQQLITLSTCYGSEKDDRIIIIGFETKAE
jgi:sortase B